MNKNYIEEMRFCFEQTDKLNLTSTQKLLWLALINANNNSYWAEWFPASLSTLIKYTKMNKRTVVATRETLTENGIIEYKTGDKRSTLYRLKIGKYSQIIMSTIGAKMHPNLVQNCTQTWCKNAPTLKQDKTKGGAPPKKGAPAHEREPRIIDYKEVELEDGEVILEPIYDELEPIYDERDA